MIVVDTNTIAYLYLPTEHSADVENVFRKDSHWVAPTLWRSEFRNILSVYMRKDLIDIDRAIQMQGAAEVLLLDNEYAVQSSDVLRLAGESGCSAYDCEFVAVARYLGCNLVTSDKKVLASFSDTALSPTQFLKRQ